MDNSLFKKTLDALVSDKDPVTVDTQLAGYTITNTVPTRGVLLKHDHALTPPWTGGRTE